MALVTGPLWSCPWILAAEHVAVGVLEEFPNSGERGSCECKHQARELGAWGIRVVIVVVMLTERTRSLWSSDCAANPPVAWV